jgi:hypothetical protein
MNEPPVALENLPHALFNRSEQLLEKDRLDNVMVDFKGVSGEILQCELFGIAGKDDEFCLRFDCVDLFGILMSVMTISGACVLKSSKPILPFVALRSVIDGYFLASVVTRNSSVMTSSSTTSIDIGNLGAAMDSISHLYPEFGAFAGVARGKPAAHVFFDDRL